MRTAPDNSGLAGVKDQLWHDEREGDKARQNMRENEMAKQFLDAAFVLQTTLICHPERRAAQSKDLTNSSSAPPQLYL
jgi:hypothetical protein